MCTPWIWGIVKPSVMWVPWEVCIPYLRNCQGISDVSVLGGVHTLNWMNCRGISDVSALGGVHTLNWMNCRGISDVSALGGVHTLNWMNCRGIRDVSALRGCVIHWIWVIVICFGFLVLNLTSEYGTATPYAQALCPKETGGTALSRSWGSVFSIAHLALTWMSLLATSLPLSCWLLQRQLYN
jgi:hypothetical protein